MVAAWLEAVALSRHDPQLAARLSANQLGFRDALVGTLQSAGHGNPEELSAALMTLCDGLMVRQLLHGDAPHPLEIAEQLAAASPAL